MEHICYHILSDQNTKHIPVFEDVKILAEEWKSMGDSNIRIYKIIATEFNSDEISISEELIPEEQIFTKK